MVVVITQRKGFCTLTPVLNHRPALLRSLRSNQLVFFNPSPPVLYRAVQILSCFPQASQSMFFLQTQRYILGSPFVFFAHRRLYRKQCRGASRWSFTHLRRSVFSKAAVSSVRSYRRDLLRRHVNVFLIFLQVGSGNYGNGPFLRCLLIIL